MKKSLTHARHPELSIGLLLVGMAFATVSQAADPRAPSLDWGRAVAGQPLAPSGQPAFGGLSAPAPIQPKVVARPPALVRSMGLFALEDRTIVTVGGKSTTAGAVKQALQAQIAAKAGAPKTVHGGVRRLASEQRDPGPGVPTRSGGGSMATGAPIGPTARPRATTVAQASAFDTAQAVRVHASPSVAADKGNASLASLRCPDQGVPTITESPGRLKAGGTATVWGQCFGDRPGRVEVIGQFPGGKLTLAFKTWDPNSIALEIPASVRGAPDHPVAVTVVTADGKTSTAMQAQFVASRERVEVPDRAWQPGAGFELASTNVDSTNPAAAGQIAKSVHVNPQCALDAMDAIVLSGGITQISGFENGPPNEAQVRIDWVGTCVDSKTTTSYTSIVAMGDDISFKSACSVAFQVRTWANCPAGVAP